MAKGGNQKGKAWFNNGIEERLVPYGTVLEGDDWIPGRLKSSVEKWMESEHNSPNHYYNSNIKDYSPRCKPRKKK